jgi:nucleoside diphosphate kinase
MTREQAAAFYAIHKERPFFGELITSMTAGPVVVQVLEGEDAINIYRNLLGATDPAKAAPGTIRKEFALSLGENSAHGSDGPETVAVEIAKWFSAMRSLDRASVPSLFESRRQDRGGSDDGCWNGSRRLWRLELLYPLKGTRNGVSSTAGPPKTRFPCT